MKKICSILLLVVLLGTMVLSAFAAEGEPATDPYTAAADGDLLYSVDFKGTTGTWEPSLEKGTDKGKETGSTWNANSTMAVTPDAEDSTKATVTLGKKENSAWGSDVEGLPLADGNAYTIKFTVTRTVDEPIGLLFNGHNGVYAYTEKSRPQWNGGALSGYDWVSYTDVPGMAPTVEAPSVQEYAVSVKRFSEETVSYYQYSVHVKDNAGKWAEIHNIKTAVNGDLLGIENPKLGLFFYAYYLVETGVVVSDVNVFKGDSVVANENTARDNYDAAIKAYNETADGTLLYTADFKGTTGVWEPSSEKGVEKGNEVGTSWNADNAFVVTPDETDGTKATFKSETENKKNICWGSDVENLPLADGFSYTVKFTLTRTKNDYFGFFFNGHNGAYFNVSQARPQLNGKVLAGNDWTSYALYPSVPSGTPSEQEPSVQEYAFTVKRYLKEDVSYYDYTMNVKDDDGKWVELFNISTDVIGDLLGIEMPKLGLFFYDYNIIGAEAGVVVSDMKVYKGDGVVAAENAAIKPSETETGEGSTEEKTEQATNPPPILVEDDEDPTEAVIETSTEETPAAKSGCGSSIGAAAAMIFAVGAAGIAFGRKKHD